MPQIDGERLRRAMELAGVSNDDLASAVGVTSEYIAMMRHGKRGAHRRPELRKRIADTLGVPQDWIEQPEGTS